MSSDPPLKNPTLTWGKLSLWNRELRWHWYLATNADYRTIGHWFGVSKATAITEVCTAIVMVLLPRYIQVPSGNELKKVMEGFKNELQCAGVVDGTHIPIKSVLLIITIAMVFTPLSCREWWKILDVLWMCTLDGQEEYTMWEWTCHYTKEAKMEHFPDWKESICREEIPLLVLGDPPFLAYESPMVVYPASKRPLIIGWVKHESLSMYMVDLREGGGACSKGMTYLFKTYQNYLLLAAYYITCEIRGDFWCRLDEWCYFSEYCWHSFSVTWP